MLSTAILMQDCGRILVPVRKAPAIGKASSGGWRCRRFRGMGTEPGKFRAVDSAEWTTPAFSRRLTGCKLPDLPISGPGEEPGDQEAGK